MEVLQRLHNRGSISTGFNIDNSLKFEADNSEYMHFTSSSQTDYERMAYSVWLKRTELGTSQVFMEFGHGTANTSNLRIGFDSNDRLFCYGNSIIWRQTNRVFRDTSAWYHLFFLFDTTTPGGLSNNRIRIWVNGEMIDHGDFGVINNPSAGSAMGFNNSLNHTIGRQTEDATAYFCGYMAQAYSSGGTPPVVGDFGEYDDDNIWTPIDISEITPPDANGFNLDFSNSSNLGNDISSRNNNMTLVNISAADQATDTPTNNFAIANPLLTVGGFMKPTEGGTKGVLSTAGPGNNTGGTSLVSTIPVSKGKWYFEAQNTNSGDAYLYLGVGDTGSINLWGIDGVKLSNQTSSSVAWRGGGAQDGKVYGRSGGTNYTSTNPVTWETEVVGLALDLDNEKIYFHKSGTWINSGDPANGTNNGGQYDLVTGVDNQWLIAVSAYNLATWLINFGGYTTMSISSAETDANGYGTFEYAPPSGYYALCTKNLAQYG